MINGTTYNIGCCYNSAGELNGLTYPSGRIVNPGYDAVGRMTQISSGGTNYLSGMNYNSAQLPTGFSYGNGVQASFGYNDHLQLSSLSYVSGANTLLNLTYGYADTNGNNNGQIQGITDTRGAAFSTAYTYDGLGRLSQAQTNDLTATNTWRLAWSYDRYGNRLSQTLTGGTIAVGQPQLTVDATTNHITMSGFNYDANGNLTQDTAGTYTYDAENRMTQSVVNSVTTSYAYDGNRLRVVKGPTVYIYSAGKIIAEYANGSLSKEYIYSGSKLVATIAGTTVTYHHPDHLSNRVETDASGNITRTFAHLPFGENWYETGTADKWKFTSYERDQESGLDYATFRYYGNGYGRFTSADPLQGSLGNPQSLNRYAYVTNDPANRVDPFGLHLFLITTFGFCSWSVDGDGNVSDFSCLLFSTVTDLGPGPNDNDGTDKNPKGLPPHARDRSRILLSNADCAKFLKDVLSALGELPDLDTFLQRFDKLTIVPTPAPSSDPYLKSGGRSATAHVDPFYPPGTPANTVVHVDNPSAPDLSGVLLHEELHTFPYSLDDLALAHAIGQMTDVTAKTSANENSASAIFSDEMKKHCHD